MRMCSCHQYVHAVGVTGCTGAGGSGKRIQEDWKVVLGESALDIKAGNVSTAADGTGIPVDPPALQAVLVRRTSCHSSCCFSWLC